MTSSAQNKNLLGNSLKLSLESLKPIKLPFIYLSFVIMTILHIGFYSWQAITQQNNLKIIDTINFDLLLNSTNNYELLTEISSLLEGHIFNFVFIGLINVLIWAFIANMMFSGEADWKKSLRYTLTRTPIKLVSLICLVGFIFAITFSLLASFSAGLAQMMLFTIMTLIPYYLLTISLPRKKIAKAMNLRFYFNVITITLFMYLLKAPIDGFCDFLFMMDLSLGLKETSMYNSGAFNVGSLVIAFKSLCYSMIWISYAVWMGVLAKLNTLPSFAHSLK